MQLHVFPCCCVGVEPVAGLGPRLPHHRETLHKHPTSLLSFGGYEFCMLQSLHLCLTAQQSAHAPERLPLSLSQSSEGNGGASNIPELISNCAYYDTTSLAVSDMWSPFLTHNLTTASPTPMLMFDPEENTQLLIVHWQIFP